MGKHGVLDLERVRAAWKGHILRLLYVAASSPRAREADNRRDVGDTVPAAFTELIHAI